MHQSIIDRYPNEWPLVEKFFADRDYSTQIFLMRAARSNSETIATWAAESGKSIEEHAAMSLSPTEEHVLGKIAEGIKRPDANETDQFVIDRYKDDLEMAAQLALWGLADKHDLGSDEWTLTEYGERVADQLKLLRAA